MSWKILAGLILCNLIWSAHPLMGKWVLRDFSPSQGAWLRYSLALLTYGLAAKAIARKQPLFIKPKMNANYALLILVGLWTFFLSPLTQMSGLSISTATDNALIVAMEPLICVFLARIFLKETLNLNHWISFVVALLGFSLLIGISPGAREGKLDPELWGNLLLLLSLTGEAAYAVFGKKLVAQFSALPFFGTALGIGVLALTVCLFLFPDQSHHTVGFIPISHLSLNSFIGLLWLGPLGTAAAYLFWVKALSRVPVAAVALTLFLQPVFGALWGMMFLNERLSPLRGMGGLLILFAVLLQYFGNQRSVASGASK